MLATRAASLCETPKSPPGDYNSTSAASFSGSDAWSVKHLNPRQGITTVERNGYDAVGEIYGVKHLNPRQGITTAPRARRSDRRSSGRSVKHLNPRQGITTGSSTWFLLFPARRRACETPKSPPGDYNPIGGGPVRRKPLPKVCETPKSPPGDYNRSHSSVLSYQ